MHLTPKDDSTNSIDAREKIPVIILSDINNVGGDPDDRQSWIHALWYTDVLDIRGLIPDYWKGNGYETAVEGLDTYRKDYQAYNFGAKGYPHPDSLSQRIVQSDTAALALLHQEALAATKPLYILIWGQMTTFQQALMAHPEIAAKVRVLTIGTGRKYGPKDEVPGEDCQVRNWNGRGRNEIYDDSRFHSMWWLENNWTYNGMFSGDRPEAMFDTLATFGAMGQHIQDVTKDHPWAHYFRVGDTPTVLYLIDENHNPDDPTVSSWAGKFARPFPETRPNYYTDDAGDIDWDYADPCNSWDQLETMYAYNKSTLEARREEMYAALLEKLNSLYHP